MRLIENEIEKELNYYAGPDKKLKFKYASLKCDRTNLEEFLNFVEEGQIKPVIDSIYDFDDVSGAFTRLNQGSLNGKIIVNIAGKEANEGSAGKAIFSND